jgi:hypothetical protein
VTRQLDVGALPGPYLLFLGDTTEPGYAKTAYGLRDWAPERCLGEFSCAGATVTTGLRFLTPTQAVAAGARSLVIGVANAGGHIPESWLPSLVEAMRAGWTSSAACTCAWATSICSGTRRRGWDAS